MVEERPATGVAAVSPALDQARHRRVALGEAADGLEQVLARPSKTPGWTLRVAGAVQELRRAFRDHCRAVESTDGLLSDLRDHAPRLVDRVDALEAEHAVISSAIDEIASHVEECSGRCRAEAVEAIRECSVDAMRMISRHRQRGADLVYEAYEVDLGGG